MANIKFKIKKGDTVVVIAGNDKDKRGRVLKIVTETNRVFVEGVNLVSKHTKPNAKYPQGGIIKQEASIHLSNLMLIDASGKPTRVGRRIGEKGKLERYAKTSGEEIK
jgi:large subunit ribosomal protein L24